MLVRDIMSSPAVTISRDEELAEAARVLERLHITSLPVVTDEGHLLGVISEADVLSRHCPRGTRGDHRPDAVGPPVTVGDAMRHRALTVDADANIADVIVMLTGTSLKSLPVLVHGRVRGVVSRSDIVRAVAHGDFDAPPADAVGAG